MLYPADRLPDLRDGRDPRRLPAGGRAADERGGLDLEAIDADDAEPGARPVGQQPGQPDRRPRRPRCGRRRGAARTACRCSPTSATSSSRGTARLAASSSTASTGVVAVHSLSKRSNLAGVRVGFYAGDAELVRYLQEVRKHVGMMVPGPAQAAGVVALDDDEHVEVQRRRYRRRLRAAGRDPRRVGRSGRSRLPAGGFYLWFAVGDGWAFAERLAGRGGRRGGQPGRVLRRRRSTRSRAGRRGTT